MRKMRKEVILILGMHRSGTSAVAGAFGKLGAELPNDLMGAQPTNPLGFFESNSAVYLNDQILESLGTNWRDWRPISPQWFQTEAAQEFKLKICNILASEFACSKLIVIKDPRICRLVPLWHAALAESGFDIRIVMAFRNPLEVAESLQIRDGIPISLGLLIWLRHVLEAEVASRSLQRSVLEMSEFLADWRTEFARVGEQLSLALPPFAGFAELGVDKFLSMDLKHHNLDREQIFSDKRSNEWIHTSFAALRALKADPKSDVAINAFENIRTQFNVSSLIFGPLFADTEQSAFDRSIKCQ
jgi:hypothetical protein